MGFIARDLWRAEAVSNILAQVHNAPRFDDHTNIDEWIKAHPGEQSGYEPRDYDADPLGSYECATAGATVRIPRSEWKERIREREAKGQTGLALMATYKIKPLHQGRTPSCWSQCVTDNAHFVQAYNGGPVVRLSTGSVAGPVKNYRSRGGNCSEALKRMHKVGICSADVWPENEINNRRLWTPRAAENAGLHRVLEWDDLEPGDFDEMISLMLHEPGRTVAYCNWKMHHAVLAIDPIIDERGEVGVLTRNSGLYRDKNGFTKFFGRFSIPNDAVSIRTFSINARAA
jgi:hypothetical protein